MNDTTTLPRTTQRRPRTWLRMSVMLLLVALLAAGLIWFQQFKAGIIKHVVTTIRSQVSTVATAKASMQLWQPRQTAVGSARASNGADLAAEVAGVVDRIDFQSGQTVAAGTELLRLRPNDDDAKLAQLQANAELAAINLQRDQRQLAAHGVAQATVDSDAANLKVARGQVAAQQALMAEKLVRAPFAGRLGLRQVDKGQYIAAGTAIVTLQQLDPMYVDFYLPQQVLGQIEVGQKVEISADAYPKRTFEGTISSLNSKVDSSSRMLQVRATVANPDGALLPGMYLSVSVATGQPQSLVTIPSTAVAFNPYGSLVYVLHDAKDAQGRDAKDAQGHDAKDAQGHDAKDAQGRDAKDAQGHDAKDAQGRDAKDAQGRDAKDTQGHDAKDAAGSAEGTDQQVVNQQFVTTGAARGDQISILKGVTANDVVVTAGQLKLHNGSPVKIDNSVQPTDNPAPVPRDQ